MFTHIKLMNASKVTVYWEIYHAGMVFKRDQVDLIGGLNLRFQFKIFQNLFNKFYKNVFTVHIIQEHKRLYKFYKQILETLYPNYKIKKSSEFMCASRLSNGIRKVESL